MRSEHIIPYSEVIRAMFWGGIVHVRCGACGWVDRISRAETEHVDGKGGARREEEERVFWRRSGRWESAHQQPSGSGRTGAVGHENLIVRDVHEGVRPSLQLVPHPGPSLHRRRARPRPGDLRDDPGQT